MAQRGSLQITASGKVINTQGNEWVAEKATSIWGGGHFENDGGFYFVPPRVTDKLDINLAFDNRGSVEADGGYIRLNGKVSQFDEGTGTLGGGRWTTRRGGQISMPGPIQKVSGCEVDVRDGILVDSSAIRTIEEAAVLLGSSVLTDDVEIDSSTVAEDGGKLTIEGKLSTTGSTKVQVQNEGSIDATEGIENGDPANPLPELEIGPMPTISLTAQPAKTRLLAGRAPHIVTPVLDNHARIAPGGRHATALFVLEGDLVQHPTGRLLFDLGGETPELEHDAIRVTGDVTLDGILDLSLLADYEPQGGEQFEILTTDGGGVISGQFAAIEGGGKWSLDYQPTVVILTLIEPPPRTRIFADGFESGDLGAWSSGT